MKKMLYFWIPFFCLNIFAHSVFAGKASMNASIADYKIIVNNEEKEISNPILVMNNRTYLPVREVSEILNLYIVWEEESKTIKISNIGIVNKSNVAVMEHRGDRKVIVYNSDFKLKINGYNIQTENPIIVFNNRSYLPVREISELLNFKVDWDGEEKNVIIERDFTDEKDIEYLYPYKEGDLYGYMNAWKEVIIKPQYKYALPFSEGLAAVCNEEYKFGYINKTGELIIPYQYSHANNFSEGLAAVADDDIYIDEMDSEEDIQFMLFSEPASSYFYIDKTGNVVTPESYVDAQEFHNELSRVVLPDTELYAYIDKNGEVKCVFEYADDFEDGYATVELEGKKYIINNYCEMVFDASQYDYVKYSEGFITAKKDDLYGVLDLEGNIVIDFKYQNLSEYSEGLFVFLKDNKKGYIDINDSIIIDAAFESASIFFNGKAIVTPDENKDIMYFINKNNERISENMEKNYYNILDNGMVIVYPENKGQYIFIEKLLR